MTPVVLGSSDPISDAVASSLGVPVTRLDSPIPPGSDCVVIVAGSDPLPEPINVNACAEGEWIRLVESPMLRILKALQRAHRSAGGRRGRIVLVIPTIGMAGAAALVPYTTAVEGIRAMAKSAARQWASDNIAVNMVAAPLRLFAPTMGHLAAHLSAPAIDDEAALVQTVVDTTNFLLRLDAALPVGSTILADGGSVMLP
jgi:3-oxoacyl-[acyl-carrier protein] reductase